MIPLKITVRGERETMQMLSRTRKFPEMTAGTMRTWGRTLARNMRRSMTIANIKDFDGYLRTRTEWRQGPRARSGKLYIPAHGILLDGMKPHWVSMRRSRTRLVRWGLQAQSGVLRGAANDILIGRRKRYSVYVEPHPFIKRGYDMTRPLLVPMIRRMRAQAA